MPIFENVQVITENMNKEESTPQYLYKIVSIEDWNSSQNSNNLQLAAQDHPFVHFATEAQLKPIISKYWNNVPEFVIVKIDTTKVEGKMVLEANPGGTTKYYHLYNGLIPLNAVAESQVIHK